MKLSVPLYFIALVTSGDLFQKIREIQQYCAEEYKSKKSLRSPPHITLIPPFRHDVSIETILDKKLKPFFNKYSLFKIELNGFGKFDSRTIFIKPEENSELINMQEELRRYLSEDFAFIERDPSRKFNPHVTIASGDLRKEYFKTAWKEFEYRNFSAMWNVPSAHLLKHDEKKWIPVIEFPFSVGK